MSLIEILILAVLQGATEFLPVSSSGHLVVANALMEAWGASPVEDLLEVSVTLHLGTLASVLIYYRREILRLLSTDRRVIPLLVIGTIPAAVLGVWVKKIAPPAVEDAFLKSPLVAGLMFPVTAVLLLWAMRRSEGETAEVDRNRLDYQQLNVRQTLIIGVLQAFALLPGVSRSGSTIAAGLGVGLRRQSAATFAFLLAIPAILGAGVLEGYEIYKKGSAGTPAVNLALGFVVSMIVGLAALSLLIRWVERGRLALFAYYLIPLGIAVTAWQLSAR
ncbi:MAG: undecaprenyl-diphosphate phosphatase [Planctomycetales bacterium]|nr:undecaprenyl-diphosphate phosphatase [Planctomycetales bacterium]